MNFGQNLYQWFLSNAQSLVLMAIVVIDVYKRQVSERVNRICLLLFCSSSARLSSSSSAPWSIIPMSSANSAISERI